MESFEKMAEIYISKYEEQVKNCSLQKNAKQTLESLLENGITSSILTASLETMAIKQLEDYIVKKYFIAVTGKKDYYASGKSELIKTHLEKIDYKPSEIVFVGDTSHDMEIADKIGCAHIIVMNGHQDVSEFAGKKMNTAMDLEQVSNIILGKKVRKAVSTSNI